jgi:hypothetical protein
MSRSKSISFLASAAVIPLAALAVAGCGGGGSASASSAPAPPASELAPIHGPYHPTINPANFVATVDNPYMPLKPGTIFHFEGVKGTAAQTDDVVVTNQTIQILGVKCTVVRDTVSEHGRAVERTFDWYAQDKQGNVWYMGENSLELQHGRFVRASDSWKAGVGVGKPGIIMAGNPRRGERYRQEFFPPGKALDIATVLGRRGSVKVPFGTFRRPLVTSEFSPAEPQTEQKYYVKGVGEVRERVVKGGHEQFDLVSVKKP